MSHDEARSAEPSCIMEKLSVPKAKIITADERRCLHTPCHTQDSTCFYLEDKKADQRGVFTG